MILEWLEGVSLADDLSERRRRRMPGRSLDEALTLLEPAAEGLGVAHQRRVAHRDIKPANFFLLKGGSGPRVKVLDFGIAKIIRDGDGPGTRSPFTSFTWLYAAPEQLDPRLGASGLATDVYAFALLLTELLTDRPPTAERDVVALLKAATDPTVRPTPRHRGASVPDAFEVACRRALAVDPRARFASIPELWSALVAGRRASTPASRAAPPAYPPPGGPPYPPPLRPSYGQPSAVSSQAPSPAAMQVAQGPSQAPMAQAPTQLAPSGHFSVASASRQPAGPFSSPAASAMSPPPMSPPPGARVYAHPRRLVPQASSSWPVVVTVIALVLGGVLLVTCSALQASC
jgi:serine/threonine-protein kinase